MSIRIKTLDAAIAEAKRFIEAADVAKRCQGHSYVTLNTEKGKADPWLDGGQYCAAVKRASMDLSRALAGVRRGGG